MKKFNTSKTLFLLTSLIFLLNSCTVEIRIDGCTDACAANYDPLADDDDGSCLYAAGCTDPAANNYDPCAGFEDNNACNYSCDVVYYLDYSAAQYMINNSIPYYTFYDYSGSSLGMITSDWWWSSPPNGNYQSGTLTTTLYWSGNYGSNAATFAWSAYDHFGNQAYSNVFTVFPNECIPVELSKKKIQSYQASK